MTDNPKLTPQAAYQRRRRAQQRPVVYFPKDRARLDQALRESGLSAQAWMERAVQERLERQARFEEKVAAAVHQFTARCFWNIPLDRPLATLAPIVVRRLRKYGGMEGIKMAEEIVQLAPGDIQWH